MSTLHTSDVAETIIRIVAAFPEHQREQARVILAGVLRGVVSQRLLRSSDGTFALPAISAIR